MIIACAGGVKRVEKKENTSRKEEMQHRLSEELMIHAKSTVR